MRTVPNTHLDPLRVVVRDTRETLHVVKQCVDALHSRQVSLSHLERQSDELSAHSTSLEHRARKLNQTHWCRYVLCILIVVSVCFSIVVYYDASDVRQ